VFDKNYDWGLYAVKNMYKIFGCGCFSKVFFTWKCIKMIWKYKKINLK
jgi:hypothetical protein